MGQLYDENSSEEEIMEWWAAELRDSTFVGSDNSGERVQYVARSAEIIEKNVNFILGRLVNLSASD
jgi:hypothetical protein